MSPARVRLAQPDGAAGVTFFYSAGILAGFIDRVGEGDQPYYHWEFIDWALGREVDGFAGSLAAAADAMDAERWRWPMTSWQGMAEPRSAAPAEIVIEDPAMVARIARRRAEGSAARALLVALAAAPELAPEPRPGKSRKAA